MAYSLPSAIKAAFSYIESYGYGSQPSYTGIINDNIKYLNIPLSGNTFEVPLFAFNSFYHHLMDNTMPDAIIAILNTANRMARYKSLDRSMRDLIRDNFLLNRLIKTDVKQGSNTFAYYVTYGAVFNQDFLPLMLCSWQMQKHIKVSDDGKADVTYQFLKPILRVSPEVYINKSNPMERYIANKMITTCLSLRVENPFIGRSADDITEHTIRVEITENPLLIYGPDAPSISTTNKELLQVAANHVEEIAE